MQSTSYIVVELKTKPFKPEHTGQLNFYVTVIDDQLRSEDDKPTVGILLCASHDEAVVRYALHGFDTPIAVAGFRYADLPVDVRAALPEDAVLNATMRSAIGPGTTDPG